MYVIATKQTPAELAETLAIVHNREALDFHVPWLTSALPTTSTATTATIITSSTTMTITSSSSPKKQALLEFGFGAYVPLGPLHWLRACVSGAGITCTSHASYRAKEKCLEGWTCHCKKSIIMLAQNSKLSAESLGAMF